MSFFQGLGNFAGGMADGASPFLNMMLRDKLEQDKETRDSEKLQGAMSMMQDQVPAYTPQEISGVANAEYTPTSDKVLIPDGQSRQSSGGSIADAMTAKKASFIDTLANLNPNEALGMYTAKLAEHGVKIDKTSLGVFDMLSKGVAQGKADLIAEEDRNHKLAQTKAQGIAVTEFFKDKPQYAPIFTALAENGVAIEDAAPLLSTLIKDENSADSLINKMLLGQMNIGSREKIADENNDTKELIASQNNDTKSLIAAIHGSNSGANNEWKQIMRQDKLDKQEQDRQDKAKAKQESDAKYLLDRKADRTKNANSVLKNIPNFDKMKSNVEKQKAIDGYIKSGIVPTIKTDANGVHYASFGTKSNPTKKTTTNDKVKEKKHDPYGLL